MNALTLGVPIKANGFNNRLERNKNLTFMMNGNEVMTVERNGGENRGNV